MGTAMGTKCAPSYANIFMGKIEEKLLTNFHLQPLLWVRFIDDIFMIWTHGIQSLEDFFQYANSSHDTIKFTTHTSVNEIEFLDTKVKIDPETRELYTTLYTKPTDTRDFLHQLSWFSTPC